MARQFFFAPIMLPHYNERQRQRFLVGAAAHKVVGMVAGMRAHARRAVIVSSPIVTASRDRKFFAGFACRDASLPCAYLPAISLRGLNRIFAAFCYLRFAWQQVKRDDVVVLYNYFPEYILVAAWLRLRLGRERVLLDIEDGPRSDENDLRGFVTRASLRVLKRLCSERAIVVSRELAQSLSIDDACVVNGVCAAQATPPRAFGTPITFLYGGTIETDTGLYLFAEGVRRFAKLYRALANRVRFVVSGFGGGQTLETLAREMATVGVCVELHQDIGPHEYRQLLAGADVGLSLRIPGTELATTTFPSKVVEFASQGLLVLSTDVSDVSLLFDEDSAALIREATPDALAHRIASIVENPDAHRRVAEQGRHVIEATCGRREVGARLIEFLDVVADTAPQSRPALRPADSGANAVIERAREHAPLTPATTENE
ncbi:glycosyltransferase [Trinickia sp. NRRL B-1857]|uniref:glycosyltransferase family protein n=1 Tax=Trinickia sp. NRRL B-1857 TaxID=3162879 RepID=UPI003D26738E